MFLTENCDKINALLNKTTEPQVSSCVEKIVLCNFSEKKKTSLSAVYGPLYTHTHAHALTAEICSKQVDLSTSLHFIKKQQMQV